MMTSLMGMKEVLAIATSVVETTLYLFFAFL